MKTRFPIYLFAVLLIVASLACSFNVGGPDYPEQSVPVSTADAQTLVDIFQQSMLASMETGVLSIAVNESQLTSLVAEKLSAQSNPPFSDPQVLLRDGQVKLYGKITKGWATANMLIVMNATINPETGMPKMQIVSADFGPIPAPEGVNNAISAMIDEAFTGSFGPVAVGFRLENISVENGVMTLSGRVK